MVNPEGVEHCPDFADELMTRFTYHSFTGTQPARYVEIRSLAHGLATFMLEACPPSRELSLALTNLEEAVMWANAAIARRE